MKKPIRKPEWATILTAASLLLTLALESLNRRTPAGGFEFLVQHPVMFIFNMLIVLDTLAVSLFFRRRLFAFCAIALLWLTCGTVNCLMVGFRTLPFTVIDLTLLKDAIGLFDVYFNLPQRILICAAGAALVLLVLFLFFKAPRSERLPMRRSMSAMLMLVMLTMVGANLGINSHMLSTSLGNLTSAYREYGFAYCFLVTFVDVGIDKPENYSSQAIARIERQIDTIAGTSGYYQIRPNVVFVQLESFFDPKHVNALGITEDPVPTFTRLKRDYPSGYLTMPSVGGGTANSEFEVLTGMTLSHFGAGEYPYNTVLKDHAVESICYNLRDLGYTSHAIHDHSGSFYNRNLVYPQMGFDTFTPLEYMDGMEYNQLGWAKDAVLTQQVLDVLRSTEGRDFVFCVTVQSHGHYPDEQTVDGELIDEFDLDEASYWGLEYYLQEIREVDKFIAALTRSLNALDEPTVAVFYGDHLPSLGLTDEDLENGDLYQTEYVIWNNYSAMLGSIADRDLCAYQLGAYVTDLLQIHSGEIYRLHQSYLKDPAAFGDDYLDQLQMLEYDMLYGDKQIYKGKEHYSPTAMRMGTKPIEATEMYVSDGALVVTGSGFTDFSEVFFDDEQIATIFVSPQLLVATQIPQDGQTVSVGQVTNDHAVLSNSNKLLYHAPEE